LDLLQLGFGSRHDASGVAESLQQAGAEEGAHIGRQREQNLCAGGFVELLKVTGSAGGRRHRSR
jgi:hypothetical protein